MKKRLDKLHKDRGLDTSPTTNTLSRVWQGRLFLWISEILYFKMFFEMYEFYKFQKWKGWVAWMTVFFALSLNAVQAQFDITTVVKVY